MIREITRLLKGKTSSMIRSLSDTMQVLASELKFEQAAEIKTQLESLKRYADRQKMVAGDGLDRDVFAVAAAENEGCGVVFKIREGKLLGSQHIYINNTNGETDAELQARVVEKYYLETLELIPDEILLQEALAADEEDALRAYIVEKQKEENQEKKKHPVFSTANRRKSPSGRDVPAERTTPSGGIPYPETEKGGNCP